MARRIAYRKKRQNRFSMFLAVLVVGLLLVVVSVGSARIMTKLSAYEERKAELEQAIAEEEKRTEQIEEYRKYTQTSKYVEEVAKDKLGLVYDGETIFKDEDSE
ncbi:MAG: septum formation initiator family protein [Eubacteriales bacterium]|nr:septum formation initiator family protein [Eubacteriales bacterium]